MSEQPNMAPEHNRQEVSPAFSLPPASVCPICRRPMKYALNRYVCAPCDYEVWALRGSPGEDSPHQDVPLVGSRTECNAALVVSVCALLLVAVWLLLWIGGALR